MVKLWTYFLSLLIFASCTQKEWYKKEISLDEHQKIAEVFNNAGGNTFYYQGSVPEQMLLQEALKYDTNNAALWRELGTARLKRGLADEMEFYYGKAVEKDAFRWAGFRGYLYLYFYREYQKAIDDFDHSDRLMGEVGFSQGQNHDYMRGICFYGLKEYDKALFSLNRYINTTTEDEGEEWVEVMAFLYKGLVLKAMGNLDSALVTFDKVLTYYPQSSDALFHQATIHFQRNNFQMATNKLSEAREHFLNGSYHLRPYVEVLDQIYIQDFDRLSQKIVSGTS